MTDTGKARGLAGSRATIQRRLWVPAVSAPMVAQPPSNVNTYPATRAELLAWTEGRLAYHKHEATVARRVRRSLVLALTLGEAGQC